MLALSAFAQVPPIPGQPSEAFALRIVEITPGTGALAAPGKKYVVHYTGWLTDGTKFDSSVDRKEPLDFVQGRRQVIAGWDSGFEGMKVGGKRRLFIPYQLAYGEKGSGTVIPPKAELIFDVELLDVKDVPETPPAAEILLSFNEAAGKIVQLAKAVPEDKYPWRPGKDVRSFGQVFIHIAFGNQLLMNAANGGLPSAMPADAPDETKPYTKAEIVGMLESTFASERKAMEKERAGGLGRDASLFGVATTRRGIFISLDAHMSEHLGQAIAYARMNGITPPWSEKK